MGAESMHQARPYATDYVSGPPSNQSAYASSAGLRYSPEHHYSTVGSYGHYETAPRRQSYQAPAMSGRDSFNEALDKSRHGCDEPRLYASQHIQSSQRRTRLVRVPDDKLTSLVDIFCQ
jgi:hypothetical protein